MYANNNVLKVMMIVYNNKDAQYWIPTLYQGNTSSCNILCRPPNHSEGILEYSSKDEEIGH
jgi:hypothetical protein